MDDGRKSENHSCTTYPFTKNSTPIWVLDLVKEVKRISSSWLHEKGISGFKWQAGYASFSVSQLNLKQAEKYVSNQLEHHNKTSFQDELRAFFRKHDLDFDEEYVWD